MPESFRVENVGAFLSLGFHLPRHGVDQVTRWCDVLDLDTRNLDTPGGGGIVDHGEQPGINAVALGKQFIEVHGAHDGTDIGHGQVEDCQFQLVDLIGGLGGIENLEEHHAIDRDHGIVLGNDFLRRHVHDTFHHVELGADTVNHRHDQVKAGSQGPGVATEAFNGVFASLGNGLHAHDDQHYSQYQY